MPIEVRHGPPAGIEALAGLMGGMGRGAVRELESRRETGQLLAGFVQQTAQQAVQLDAQRTRQADQIKAQQAQQAAQLNAQRAAQMRQIAAQADRQKEAADTAFKRTALAAGLQEEIQEQQFDNQMVKMQEAARIQASQFEYQYTTQQRQRMARNNDSRQMVRSSPNFNEAEKVTMLRALDMDDMQITPGTVPADPNKAVYPEGQGIGQSWKDPFGNIKTRKPDGEEVTQIKFPDTPEGIQRKHKQAMELKALEREIKLRDQHRTYEMKLDEMTVPEMQEAEPGYTVPLLGIDTGIGAKEAGAVGERYLTEGEKLKRLRHHFPELYAEQQTEQPAAEVREQPQQQVEDPNWAARYEAGGVKVMEADRKLPSKVGKAQAYIRHMIPGQYKGTEEMPPEVREAFMEASRLLQSYYQAVAEQRE